MSGSNQALTVALDFSFYFFSPTNAKEKIMDLDKQIDKVRKAFDEVLMDVHGRGLETDEWMLIAPVGQLDWRALAIPPEKLDLVGGDPRVTLKRRFVRFVAKSTVAGGIVYASYIVGRYDERVQAKKKAAQSYKTTEK